MTRLELRVKLGKQYSDYKEEWEYGWTYEIYLKDSQKPTRKECLVDFENEEIWDTPKKAAEAGKNLIKNIKAAYDTKVIMPEDDDE